MEIGLILNIYVSILGMILLFFFIKRYIEEHCWEWQNLFGKNGWFKRKFNYVVGGVVWLIQNIGVTITSAIAFIMFWWKCEEKRGLQPSILIERLQNDSFIYDKENFVPLEMSFYNPNPFPLFITELKLRNKKKGILAASYQAFDSTQRRLVSNDENNQKTISCILTIPPFIMTGGKPLRTGTVECQDMFFISKELLSGGKNQLEFQIKYQKIPAKRKTRKISVYSSPIEHEVTLFPYENREFLEKNRCVQ